MRTWLRTKHWRWWLAAGAVAAFVLRRGRLRHDSPSLEPLTPLGEDTSPTTAAQRSRTDESVLALGRRLVETRAAQTDVDRELCLLRAAEILLESKTAAAVFAAAHREAFLNTRRNGRAQMAPGCARCGGPVHEASSYDATLGESLPVWECRRCGAQAPR